MLSKVVHSLLLLPVSLICSLLGHLTALLPAVDALVRLTTETSEDPAGEAPSGRGGWSGLVGWSDSPQRPARTRQVRQGVGGVDGPGWLDGPAHHRDQRGPGR